MKTPPVKLCSVQIDAGQSTKLPSSWKSTVGLGSMDVTPLSVMLAEVFRKLNWLEFKNALFEVTFRFDRLMLVLTGTVTVGKMRMLPLVPLNKVVVMLLSKLVASVVIHSVAVRNTFAVAVLFDDVEKVIPGDAEVLMLFAVSVFELAKIVSTIPNADEAAVVIVFPATVLLVVVPIRIPAEPPAVVLTVFESAVLFRQHKPIPRAVLPAVATVLDKTRL